MKWQGANATSQTTELGGESLFERLFFCFPPSPPPITTNICVFSALPQAGSLRIYVRTVVRNNRAIAKNSKDLYHKIRIDLHFLNKILVYSKYL